VKCQNPKSQLAAPESLGLGIIPGPHQQKPILMNTWDYTGIVCWEYGTAEQEQCDSRIGNVPDGALQVDYPKYGGVESCKATFP